jgi:hypothetical protein
MKTAYANWITRAACALLALSLTGCTPNITGVYTCQGGLLDSLRLESGGKAYATSTFLGIKQEHAGTYTVDGDKVNLLIDQQSTVFTLKDKTLDGGGFVGSCTIIK